LCSGGERRVTRHIQLYAVQLNHIRGETLLHRFTLLSDTFPRTCSAAALHLDTSDSDASKRSAAAADGRSAHRGLSSFFLYAKGSDGIWKNIYSSRLLRYFKYSFNYLLLMQIFFIPRPFLRTSHITKYTDIKISH